MLSICDNYTVILRIFQVHLDHYFNNNFPLFFLLIKATSMIVVKVSVSTHCFGNNNECIGNYRFVLQNSYFQGCLYMVNVLKQF